MGGTTENYGLKLWGTEDSPSRAGVNGNWGLVDAALAGKTDGAVTAALESRVAGKPEIVAGAYTGDGATSRFIGLGFTPKAVLVVCVNGAMRNGSVAYGGLTLPNNPVIADDGSVLLTVVTNGFQVVRGYRVSGTYYADTNNPDKSYYYLAVK